MIDRDAAAMAKIENRYTYVDLGALASEMAESSGPEDCCPLDAKTSCLGKVLLLITSSGMEIVRIPTQVH